MALGLQAPWADLPSLRSPSRARTLLNVCHIQPLGAGKGTSALPALCTGSRAQAHSPRIAKCKDAQVFRLTKMPLCTSSLRVGLKTVTSWAGPCKLGFNTRLGTRNLQQHSSKFATLPLRPLPVPAGLRSYRAQAVMTRLVDSRAPPMAYGARSRTGTRTKTTP